MSVTVETGSRLHLGLVDFTGVLGRVYGGCGVYLKNPRLRIKLSESSGIKVEGSARKSIESCARRFIEKHGIEGGVEIKVESDIPAHAGLGSGTQSALAVSAGLARLYDIKTTTNENAILHGRGKISAVGTHLFDQGGFVLDGGHPKESSNISPLTAKIKFPENWAFILVTPMDETGLSGLSEANAIEKIGGRQDNAREISHIILMQLLPALAEEDIISFGEAVYRIDRITGDYFKKIQGGIYKEEKIKQVVEHMMSSGAAGCGQSSWGPTVYGLVKEDECNDILDNMEGWMKENEIKAEVTSTKSRNTGREISY